MLFTKSNGSTCNLDARNLYRRAWNRNWKEGDIYCGLIFVNVYATQRGGMEIFIYLFIHHNKIEFQMREIKLKLILSPMSSPYQNGFALTLVFLGVFCIK